MRIEFELALGGVWVFLLVAPLGVVVWLTEPHLAPWYFASIAAGALPLTAMSLAAGIRDVWRERKGNRNARESDAEGH